MYLYVKVYRNVIKLRRLINVLNCMETQAKYYIKMVIESVLQAQSTRVLISRVQRSYCQTHGHWGRGLERAGTYKTLEVRALFEGGAKDRLSARSHLTVGAVPINKIINKNIIIFKLIK